MGKIDGDKISFSMTQRFRRSSRMPAILKGDKTMNLTLTVAATDKGQFTLPVHRHASQILTKWVGPQIRGLARFVGLWQKFESPYPVCPESFSVNNSNTP